MLKAISPIDGRYAGKTKELADFFSEFALIKYRILVEVEYFKMLCGLGLPQLEGVQEEHLAEIERIANQFDEAAAQQVKDIEKTTNHDVKAVEYYLKEQFDAHGLGNYKEFIHFGLTSQDVNNTAVPLSLKHGMEHVLQPALHQLVQTLSELADNWKDIPMLARTHGQPASPTLLGKELQVYIARLNAQLKQLESIPYSAKFGGATGNMNAHYVSYPDIDWHAFATKFVHEHLGLERSYPTTQIEHYDNTAALFHAMSRINTILIDLCRDVWTYISMEYFKQKLVAGEVGSSTMPHKVNPIDFENAEGNFGIANALFNHLANKLPISRLQRDLTDSTVLRNVGVPLGHTQIALKSLLKGLGKLKLNTQALEADLENNWAVVGEAIQSVLRREGFPKPYEALKALTRNHEKINAESMHAFIDGLAVSDAVKEELKQIRPENYVGKP